MNNKKSLIILAGVLLTALVVGVVVYFVRVQQIAELQQQVKALEEEKAELQNSNAELQEQVAVLKEQIAHRTEGEDGVPGVVISRSPLPGWEAYFPESGLLEYPDFWVH